jgi:hypothetical protein
MYSNYMQNMQNMSNVTNFTNMFNTNLNINSSINADDEYIRHNNWLRYLREEYDSRASLIEKKDLVEFKKEWNSRLPPLIKRSSPCPIRPRSCDSAN